MVQVDLITGFLGSGKTTFMRHYARYMVQQGWNVCILENDFGAVNVDVMLLQDILGDHCDMESISGGCDCDTHQRRMRTKLISLAMQGTRKPATPASMQTWISRRKEGQSISLVPDLKGVITVVMIPCIG